MLDIKQKQEIEVLRNALKDEIAKRSLAEMTIPNHICVNNLKSKLERLNGIEESLEISKYKVVFIGTVGAGKTTAICHLFNLIGEFKVSKTVSGKTKTITETQELLSTGAGRTTICEVIIKPDVKTSIEIEPYPIDKMESLINEFCGSFSDGDEPSAEEAISEEIKRAVRNITNYRIETKTFTDGDRKQVRVDTAKEALKELGLDGFKQKAIENSGLERRVDTKIEFDSQKDEKTWIKETFRAVNQCEIMTFALPKRIYVHVSENVLKGSDMAQFEAIVDTKGVDENPIRKDLHKYITSKDTICLFTTTFNDAPETNIRELMKYYLTSKSKDFHHRFATFVMPRKEEPEKENGGDGTWETGVDVKKEVIQSVFKGLNLEFFPENVLFYDSLRYYQKGRLDSEYTEEDIQEDKNRCISDIRSTIERREQTLANEIDGIRESFERIKSGESLTEIEIQLIATAIQKIKALRDLKLRLPSFVYESFISEYVLYYRNNYPAWNTKHAIHKRFGFYDMRNIDIYYDAKVVAEGRDEDEMLKKFTKEVKQEVELILDDLKTVNEDLETLIPELRRRFETYYDNFIQKVGSAIENYLYQIKLAPQDIDSDFWKALLDEKGKLRARNETYTDNVCLTLQRELENDNEDSPNLNVFLQEKTEELWKKVVNNTLSFFGEE
jgi:hypothetical protein